MEDIKYKFDQQFPRSVINVEDFRANLRGLHQMDFAPLRPTTKNIIDEMEYSTDAAAQAQYAGTGVTITSQAVSGSLVQEGSFSIKAVTDVTADRSFERDYVLDLSAYEKILLWERSSQAGDTFQFYLKDGDDNESYWNITADAGGGVYQQDEIDLTTPDDDSGTPADLSDIVSYGFRLLTASTTYYFDTIKAIVEMAVVVVGTNLGSYFRHLNFQGQPIQVSTQISPQITPPISLPRVDILTINYLGVLDWIQGDEDTALPVPWDDITGDVIPICEVLMKTTMTKVLDYDDKDIDTDQGYILADVRPFISFPAPKGKGADIASAANIALGNDGNFFDVTGTTTITSITAKPASFGPVFLKFTGILTLTDGSNLKLNGNFVTAAGAIIQLICDGTNWWEVSRCQT